VHGNITQIIDITQKDVSTTVIGSAYLPPKYALGQKRNPDSL